MSSPKSSPTKPNGLLGNFVWKFAERISAQLISLIVAIQLARLLDPVDFGAIAMVEIFIALANVFVVDGFGSALIQKKDADAIDFSSVLYANLIFSVAIYVALFFSAPYVSRFYGEGYEILTPVLRVLGLRLILAAVNSVQQAYVSRKMIFRKFFWATFIGTTISAVVGLAMAYSGYGVWALVGQYLTNTTVNTIILAITLKKRPILAFSCTRLKSLLQFGIKILSTNLLIVGYMRLRALIIGKLYSSEDLAFYQRGAQFPDLLVNNVNSSLSSVLFPKLANLQDDLSSVRDVMQRSIRFSSFVLFPLLFGLCVVARPLVELVLTEKWAPCVPLLQLLCVSEMFRPLQTINVQAIKALGKSGVVFALEVVKKTIELISLLLVMRISVYAIVVNMAALSLFFTFVNAYPNRRLLGYSYLAQIRDLSPAILRSTAMACAVALLGLAPICAWILLPLQAVVGCFFYLALAYATKSKELLFALDHMKKLAKR